MTGRPSQNDPHAGTTRRSPWATSLKLIATPLVSGDTTPEQEIAIRIDQTLTQDATGTMVTLELEALGLDRARTEVSVQYIDAAQRRARPVRDASCWRQRSSGTLSRPLGFRVGVRGS